MKKFILIATVLMCACSHGAVAQEPRPEPKDSTRNALVQPGFGTLRQDDFTLGLRSGALLVKVTPLNESIIRLAAPDTYNRLHALAESRRKDAATRAAAKEVELFLVSFFSYEPDVTFQPEDVQLDYNGRVLRAGAIIPITPTWGKGRMAQQETQIAVYAFAEPLDYEQTLTLKYGMDQNTDWSKLIPKLQVERNKILSRQQKN
jgi:hypothetical protein